MKNVVQSQRYKKRQTPFKGEKYIIIELNKKLRMKMER